MNRNSTVDVAGADSNWLFTGTTFTENQFDAFKSTTRTFIAMVDAYRSKISTRVQSTHEPIDGTSNEIGGGHPIQPTKYKSKVKNRIAHDRQNTRESTKTDH